MPVFASALRRARPLTVLLAALALSGCAAGGGTSGGSGTAAPAGGSTASSPASDSPSGTAGAATSSSASAAASASATPTASATPSASPSGSETASPSATASASTSASPSGSGTASAKAKRPSASSGHGATDCSVEKCIALTFDDGPNPATDARLLKILAAHGVHSTFFLLGSNTASYPDTAREIAAAGHEVANHSTTHPLLDRLPAATVAAELAQASDTIEQATGVRPTLMRPPYGATSPAVRQAIADAGMRQMLWDVDTLDWKTRDPDSTLAVVKAQAHRGAVVLMHDIHAPSVAAVEPIVEWLQGQGYTLVTVSDILDG